MTDPYERKKTFAEKFAAQDAVMKFNDADKLGFCPECQSLLNGHDVNGPMCVAVQEIQRLESQLREAREALEHIGSMAGHPDAAEGCRNIIKRSKAALAKIAEMEGGR